MDTVMSGGGNGKQVSSCEIVRHAVHISWPAADIKYYKTEQWKAFTVTMLLLIYWSLKSILPDALYVVIRVVVWATDVISYSKFNQATGTQMKNISKGNGLWNSRLNKNCLCCDDSTNTKNMHYMLGNVKILISKHQPALSLENCEWFTAKHEKCGKKFSDSMLLLLLLLLW